MKKHIWPALAVLLAAVLVFLFIQSRQTRVTAFSLQDYQTYLAEFPSDEITAPIKTAEDAKKAAEEIWLRTFGSNVTTKKPYRVSYDAQAQVWLVRGSLPFYQLGGVPYILIQEDSGEVLALWHEK